MRWDPEHIDALAAKLVLDPGRFDVIVGRNLFGDILCDLAAAVAGCIGIAPSANLDPTRTYPSMFEPVHGSAPDIAGQGVANPLGAVWSAAMMLDHLGHPAAAGGRDGGDRGRRWPTPPPAPATSAAPPTRPPSSDRWWTTWPSTGSQNPEGEVAESCSA